MWFHVDPTSKKEREIEKEREMESIEAATKKPHAVCIPYPAQGHINPMLNLTKLLHTIGFHITFVNTEYNHKRLLKSRGPNSLDGLPNFRFETIPDGLSDDGDVADSTQDIMALCLSTSKNCLVPFRNLIHKLNDTSTSNVPPVTCIVSDGSMTFTVEAAQEFGIPVVMFCTASACGLLGYMQFPELLRRGIIPLKDASYITNGYLDTTMDWIPGMRNIRLKDLPSFIRIIESNNVILDYIINEVERALKASAFIFNTFDALEQDVLNALSSMLPPLYTIGPLQLLLDTQISDNNINGVMNMGSNLWKEQDGCVEWLDSQESNSVVYVNFGSITVLTRSQLNEFAWGLANSKKPFLWVIRPDLVVGDSAILPPEFEVETKGRGMLTSWCPQEQVLNHPSIGVFLTHCGWNSTLESLVGGVPIICWPFFAEQHTNCRYSCTKNEWGIGVELDNDVKRGEVEELLREVMKGEMGVEMKKKVVQWKKMAEEATRPGGSSYQNLEKLISKVLLYKGD